MLFLQFENLGSFLKGGLQEVRLYSFSFFVDRQILWIADFLHQDLFFPSLRASFKFLKSVPRTHPVKMNDGIPSVASLVLR